MLVTVQAQVSPRAFGRLQNLDLQERQSLLPGSKRGNCQVIAALVKGVDVDSPVGVWLFEPVLQHVLKVNTLPVADPGVELDLQGADADVAAALLCHGLESEDLQVDCGGLLKRPQVHPQLGLQHLGEHQFGAKLEETTAGLPIHLHQRLGLRGHGDYGLCGGVVFILFHKLILGRRVSLEVVVVQELLERRRLGQQLIDHLPADVGRLL